MGFPDNNRFSGLIRLLFCTLLLTGPTLLPAEGLEVCAIGSNSTPEPLCPQGDPDEVVSFSHESLQRGMNVYRAHPAPLGLMIPLSNIKQDENGHTYLSKHYFRRQNDNERLLVRRVTQAQKKLLAWFTEDLNRGMGVPRITVRRLAVIYELLTGQLYTFPSKMPADRQPGVPGVNQYICEMSPKIMEENQGTFTSLRERAGLNGMTWGYRIPLSGKVQDAQTYQPVILHPDIYQMLRERADFLGRFLSASSDFKGGNFIGRHGRFTACQERFLFIIDAMRLAHLVHLKMPGTLIDDVRRNIIVEPNEELFFAFDVPDIHGRTSATAYCPKNKPCANREWRTLYSNMDEYNEGYPLFTLAPGQFASEFEAMFRTSVKELAAGLKPVMTARELVQQLALSWQELMFSHLFPDANGRLVRILVNSILMAYGLPPMTCDPDCAPLNKLRTEVEDVIFQGMYRTRYFSETDYPQWISHPSQEWQKIADEAVILN